MTKLAPEWVRTSDPVIRSPARYRWTTAPALSRTKDSRPGKTPTFRAPQVSPGESTHIPRTSISGSTPPLIGILIRNIVKPTRSLYDFRFKSYGSNSDFRIFGDLDLDLWPMLYFCHMHCTWCTGISMRSFIRIRPVLMGGMPWLRFWKTPYAL